MRALSKWAGIVVAAVALGAATAQEKRPPAAVAKPRTPTPAPATATGRPAATTPPTWKEVDRLVSEQKFEEASRAIDALLQSAKARKDSAEWTKALIRSVQVRTGLHGYETAVRFLKDEPWPPDLLSRAALELFYAQSLVNYTRMYSWEVSQRERVEAKGTVDLKAWTREQIYDEAVRAYVALWKEREALGRENVKALAEFMEPNDYPAGNPPHAPRRGRVLLHGPSRRFLRMEPGAVERRLRPRPREPAARGCEIHGGDPAGRSGRPPGRSLRRRPGGSRGLALRARRTRGRVRGAAREAAPAPGCLYRGRRSGRDRERSRGAPAEDGGSALVRDGPGAARRAPRIR